MKRLFALRTKAARHTFALGYILFMVMGGPLFAQTTGSTEPSAKKDDLPPGSCMPIGLTVSGEVVFPFQCKEFIDRLKGAKQKAAVTEDKNSTADEGPVAGYNSPIPPKIDVVPTQGPAAAEQKTVAKQEDSVTPESSKPADKPAETAPLQKRVGREPHERGIGPPGCTRFRSYDLISGTYKSLDGRRLSCR